MQTLGKVVRRNQTSSATTGLTTGPEPNPDPLTSSNSLSGGGTHPKQSGAEAGAAATAPNPGSVTGSTVLSSSSGWSAVSSSNSSGAASTAAQPGRDPTAPDQLSSQSKPGTGTRPQSITSSVSGAVAAQSTPWTATPASQPAGPQAQVRYAEQTRVLGKGPLLPAQEFPELGVEQVPVPKQTESRPVVEPGPYGPGPSLRPATSANWSQGSANAAATNLPAYGPSGGGVNGSQVSDKNQQQTGAGSQPYGAPVLTGNGVAGGSGHYRGTGGQPVQRSGFPGGGGSGPAPDFRANR